MTKKIECRAGCAACCIVVSINSPIPNMPNGKPAGIRCVNLDDNNLCKIHLSSQYPKFCKGLKASQEMCGDNNEFAFNYLENLEKLTNPNS